MHHLHDSPFFRCSPPQDTKYRDSKVSKIFLVQMLSSFGSLVYCAYAETAVEGGCGELSCMGELEQLVATILVERLLYTFAFDNALPQLQARLRFARETSGVDPARFSVAESEYILDPYDLQREIINRYMDQVLMFGYMVLFVVAFPVAPLLGYISNILQIHQFGRSLLFRKQRNIPVGAQDIGMFQGCFEIVSSLAVVSNSALVFFTMRTQLFPDLEFSILVWLFFGTQTIIWGIMRLVEVSVADMPHSVMIQLKRQEFIRAECFDDDLFIDYGPTEQPPPSPTKSSRRSDLSPPRIR